MVIPASIQQARERRMGQKTQLTRQAKVQRQRMEQLKKIRGQEERVKALKTEAERLNNEFIKISYGGDIKTFTAQFNTLPPEIQKYMPINPQNIQDYQKQVISNLQKEVSKAKLREDKYDEKSKEARTTEKKDKYAIKQVEERARARAFENIIKDIQEGKIYSTGEAKRLADIKSEIRGKKRKAVQRKKVAEKLPPISKITKSYVVTKPDGTKILRSNIKGGGFIDSPIESKQLPQVQTTISSSEKRKILQEAFNTKFVNVLSDQNIEQIFRTAATTSTPVIPLQTQVKLDKIDKDKKLNEFEKVRKKREVLGMLGVTATGEVRDVFGRTQAERDLLESLNKKIRTSEVLKQQITPIEKKALIGETMSPSEILKFHQVQIERGEKLNQAQFNNFKILAEKVKTVAVSPFVYANNLGARYRLGEKNAFSNDFKLALSVAGYGLSRYGAGVRDTVNSLIGVKDFSILPKKYEGTNTDGLITKALRGIVEYDQKVFRELGKKGGDVPKLIKTDLQNLFKDTKNKLKSTQQVGQWVLENPTKTALLIGYGLNAGVIKNKKTFLDDPIGTTSYTLGALLVGVGKITKLTKLPDNLNKFYNTKTNKVNQFRAVANFDSQGVAITKINGQIDSTNLLGQKLITNYNLKYNSQTKEIVGQIFHKTEGKLSQQTIKYLDEGPYFLDMKTKIKVNKEILPVKEKNIKIKETKITPKEASYTLGQKSIGVKELSNVEVVTLSIANGVIKESTKLATVSLKKIKPLNSENIKIIKGVSSQLEKVSKIKKTKKFVPLNKNELDFLEKFLKDINYDKVIYNGLDRRTRLAKALGVTKTNPLLKRIETIVDEKGKIKSVIIKQITIVAKGKIKTEIKLPKIEIELPKRRVLNFKSDKKGRLNLSATKLEYKQISKGKLESKTISIPRLIMPLPSQQIKLKKLGILMLFNKIKDEMTKLKGVIKTRDFLKSVKTIEQSIIKINNRLKETTKVKKVKKVIKTKKKIKTKAVVKKKVVKKISPKIIPKPKVTKIVGKPIKRRQIKFSFDTPLKKGETYLFNALYRHQGKVKELKLNLPPNRALKKAIDLIDNTTNRSLQLKIVGIGKDRKDIRKPSLGKFTLRKTKTTLLLVEKNKYSIDTKGEKRGLTIGKLVKPKKKKVSKVKNVSKKKKSSKKPSKKRK